ncbi:MAG: riboflavin biosynthesis protein RibD [Gammaproteobacteria bacterium]|nr:MAG: riboflavin biosynthesis protein RibD [Gammaproteobacteria bacterium]
MTQHTDFMRRAIALAQQGLNTTTPNPRVGCVLVKAGQTIGEGYHQQAGQPHAEVNALQNAKDNGHSPTGATAYVTLEPCSHHGRTPPCAEALIAAGVAEVVIGSSDPNPEVSGRGVEMLRQAGIAVTESVLREACDELNLGFFKRMTTGLPWVTVKLGMSLDAKIATASGESQWITGSEARQDVQYLRARMCAVMTSSATVIADNPSLNVRLDNISRQPKRVVVDSQLSISPQSQLFALQGETLIYTCEPAASQSHFLAQNSRPSIKSVPENNGHADLTAVLQDLAQHQACNDVLVEAGGRFAGALLASDCVDELVIYTAPMLLGQGARPAFDFAAVAALADAKRFVLRDSSTIGNDLKAVYRRK